MINGARIVNLFLLRGFLLGIMILALILATGQSVEVSELVIELFDECVWRPTSAHTASYHSVIHHGPATCLSFYKKLAIFLAITIVWSLLISVIISSVVTRDFSRRFALAIELVFVSLVPAFLTYRLIRDGIMRLDNIIGAKPNTEAYASSSKIPLLESINNHSTALVFFIFTLLAACTTVLIYYQISKTSTRSRTRQFIVFSLLPIGFVGASCVFFVLGDEIYQMFGALNLLLLFGVFLVGTFHLLALLGHRWNVPLIGVFLTITVIQWSVFQRGESKLALRNLSATEKIVNEHSRNNPDAGPTLRQASDEVPFFEAWLDSRLDRADFANRKKPYPVYVVAVAGGGLYAALRTSRIVAELQSRCPAFLQHVFVISAVSGGALGAAVVAGAARAIPQVKIARCGDEKLQASSNALLKKVLESYFAKDLLPSLLGSALFPDLLHRLIIPATLIDNSRFALMERSKFIERVIAARWGDTVKKLKQDNTPGSAQLDPDFFKQSIHSDRVWHPRADESGSNSTDFNAQTPGVIFNTTDADLGRIFPLSRLPQDFFRSTIIVNNFSEYEATLDVASAVGISIRSPFILPAAKVVIPEKPTSKSEGEETAGQSNRVNRIIRLVDGAYADNSGLLAALDVMSTIRQNYRPKSDQSRFKIRLIYIGERADVRQCHDNECRNSMMDPAISAFLNARISSGNALVSETFLKDREVNRTDIARGIEPLLPFSLEEKMLNVEAGGSALGWLLSGQSRHEIKTEIESSLHEKCIETEAEHVKMFLRYTTMSCSLQDLAKDFN